MMAINWLYWPTLSSPSSLGFVVLVVILVLLLTSMFYACSLRHHHTDLIAAPHLVILAGLCHHKVITHIFLCLHAALTSSSLWRSWLPLVIILSLPLFSFTYMLQPALDSLSSWRSWCWFCQPIHFLCCFCTYVVLTYASMSCSPPSPSSTPFKLVFIDVFIEPLPLVVTLGLPWPLHCWW